MTIPAIFATLLALTAIFSIFNDRVIHLHRTIGVMMLSLIFSLLVLGGEQAGFFHVASITGSLSNMDFSDTIIHGMLGALLFAGGITIDFNQLKPRLFVITVIAITGVLISTFVVGYVVYYVTNFLLHLNIPLVYCLTFGAVISPTDPIAVLAILRTIGVPKELDMDVCGESLFNDGIGFVVFTFFYTLAVHSETMSAMEVSMFFIKSVGGAIILGGIASYIAFLAIRSTKDSHIHIMVTLALVFWSFEAGSSLGFSPAITEVVVGLLFGKLCYDKLNSNSRETLYTFWGVVDELLNNLLFVMVGLMLVIVPLTLDWMKLGILAIVACLFGRWISVAIPVWILQFKCYFSPRSIRILTWGGLRGALPLAMALSLPSSEYKSMILWMTYAVVVFSILIQGTTIARVAGTNPAACKVKQPIHR